MNATKYIAAGMSAYFLWGFFSFGSRPINHYPALDIMCYRMFFCVVVLSLISVIFRKKHLIADYNKIKALPPVDRKKTIGFVFLSAFILSFNWLGFIYTINEVNVQTAGLTYLICPILTTFLGVIILKEKLSTPKWVAVGLSCLACLLLAMGHFRELYMALLVALAFAIYLLLLRKINFLDSFNLLNAHTIIISILILPLFFLYGGALPQEPSFYGYVGIIVVFFTIIPMFLNNFALKGIPASTAGILIYINPIVNFLLSIFYYKEAVSGTQYFAYLVILLAIIIFNAQYLIGKAKNRNARAKGAIT